VTANAAAYAAASDGTATAELQARFETDAIPHMRQMFPAAYRLTQDRCDAEDLIQETFARAYVKFHQFETGTNVRAWLYCIMFRTFCSSRRKRGRQPAEVLADDLYRSPGGQAADSQAGLVPPSRSAEAEALDGVGDSPVMRALAELPSQFKTALYLADIQGYQQSDIADIMGTPVGTVMSRVHRGRAMLRAKLASAAKERVNPADRAPVQPVPVQAVPVQAVPVQAVPVQAVPVQAVPVQAVPVQPAPVQGVPVQPARVDGAPEAVPFDGLAAASAAGNLPLAA
jgi:RNA polymerase sigma-70 factor (ECF subfamily)